MLFLRQHSNDNTIPVRNCAISQVLSYHQHGRKRLYRYGPPVCRTSAVSGDRDAV